MMAENNGTTITETAPVVKKWAVIQTGIITPDADIIPFKDESGQRMPSILSMWDDAQKAEKMRRRTLAKLAKVGEFDDAKYRRAQPLLGIAQISMTLSKPKRQLTDAQKAAMQAGRSGKGKGAKGGK